MEVRRHPVLDIVGHRIADGTGAMAHRRPPHDRQHHAADPEQPGFVAGDEILDEGEAEGGDGPEDRVAQGGADACHVARHGAYRDGAADAEGRGRADRDRDHETDDRPFDRQRDGVEGKAGDLHRLRYSLSAVKRRGGATSRSWAATS